MIVLVFEGVFEAKFILEIIFSEIFGSKPSNIELGDNIAYSVRRNGRAITKIIISVLGFLRKPPY